MVTTFLTGPIKVWLDIKRGSTSLNELRDNLQDEKTWLHDELGLRRSGVLPTQGNNEGRARRRNRQNDEGDS